MGVELEPGRSNHWNSLRVAHEVGRVPECAVRDRGAADLAAQPLDFLERGLPPGPIPEPRSFIAKFERIQDEWLRIGHLANGAREGEG